MSTSSPNTGMMEHQFKVYAATQSFLMKYVPADVRSYTAFVFLCVTNLFISLLLLVLSPFLYIAERVHTQMSIKLPSSYSHILITGASSGVGEGLCYAYSKPGVTIVMVARSAEQLALVAANCRKRGAESVVEVMDVKDEQGMKGIVDRTEKVKALDLVIAVAGHEASMGKDEDIVGASREAVQVNFLGMLNTILPCIPYMRSRRRGQLVMFSSQLGFLAAPLATDYDSCKVAIRLYGEGLRSLLWRDNVAVNVIVPGGMITPMMNTLTERSKLPTVPFILPVSNAVMFMTEGISRNVGVIAFPSIMTAFNSALGAMPASVRTMFLTMMTSKHHQRWRTGEVEEYQDHGSGKKDDFYKKERMAETELQRKGLNDKVH